MSEPKPEDLWCLYEILDGEWQAHIYTLAFNRHDAIGNYAGTRPEYDRKRKAGKMKALPVTLEPR